jgi:hypothetical protein
MSGAMGSTTIPALKGSVLERARPAALRGLRHLLPAERFSGGATDCCARLGEDAVSREDRRKLQGSRWRKATTTELRQMTATRYPTKSLVRR